MYNPVPVTRENALYVSIITDTPLGDIFDKIDDQAITSFTMAQNRSNKWFLTWNREVVESSPDYDFDVFCGSVRPDENGFNTKLCGRVVDHAVHENFSGIKDSHEFIPAETKVKKGVVPNTARPSEEWANYRLINTDEFCGHVYAQADNVIKSCGRSKDDVLHHPNGPFSRYHEYVPAQIFEVL